MARRNTWGSLRVRRSRRRRRATRSAYPVAGYTPELALGVIGFVQGYRRARDNVRLGISNSRYTFSRLMERLRRRRR
jgi:hypothetical protein